MRKIITYKAYMKLFIANTISRFGDSVDMIAYGYMVYQLTGSKLLLATLYMFNVIPNIAFSSVAGTIVDFFSKKKIIVLGNIARATLVFLTAVLFRNGMLQTWHLLMLTFLNSTVETFVSPCTSAVIPRLVDEELYLFVNSTMQSVTKFVELLGLALAGVIIGFFDITGAIFVDGVTFLIAGILIASANFPVEAIKPLTVTNYSSAYKEGLSFVFKKKGFLSLVLGMALLNFLLTPINALAPAYVEDVLKKGPEAIGYFSIAFIIGNIIGGITVGKVGTKFSFKALIAFGLSFTGIAYACMAAPAFVGQHAALWVACISAFSVGFFVTFASSGLSTFFMTFIPKDMMARVSSVIGMFALSAMPLGSLASGIISSYFGIANLIILFGIIFILSTLLPLHALKQMVKITVPEAESEAESEAKSAEETEAVYEVIGDNRI